MTDTDEVPYQYALNLLIPVYFVFPWESFTTGYNNVAPIEFLLGVICYIEVCLRPLFRPT